MANKANIGQYQQRIMVNGQPLNAPIKPMVNTALENIVNVGREFSNILAAQSNRIDNLKLRNNEEKLSIQAQEMNNALAQAKNTEEFDTIVADYTKQMKDGSKARLGKRLYGLWQDEESNYMKALEVDVAGKKIALNKKIAFESGKDTAKDMAYQYAYGNEGARKAQDTQFNEYLKNNNFNDAEKEHLLRTYNHDKEFGYLTQLVNNDPYAVDKALKDKKNFNALSVQERERFADAAAREIKARKDTILEKGTAGEKGIADIIREFNDKYVKEPAEAEKMYQHYYDNPTALTEKYGVNGSKTIKNYMKGVLEEGEWGRQKETTWNDTKVMYQKFDVSDGVITNKDLDTVEDITNMIGIINGNLAQGTFDKHTGEANAMVANLRSNLAGMVKDPKIKNTAFWGSTAAESMPKQINTFLKRKVNGNLSDEGIGKIYEDAFITAQAEGLDLKSKDTKVKERAAQIIRNVFDKNIRAEYLLTEEEANAVVSDDDNVLLEVSDKANNKNAKKIESGPIKPKQDTRLLPNEEESKQAMNDFKTLGQGFADFWNNKEPLIGGK